MKQILFFCTTLFLFFSSCSKHPEKVLPRKDGKWDYISTVETYENGYWETLKLTGAVLLFTKTAPLPSQTTEIPKPAPGALRRTGLPWS